MPVARERAGHWVAAFEDVYDAREARTRSLLLPYARAQEGGDTAFTGDREFIAVQSRFVQFVCNRVIHQVIAAAELPNDR
jgi:hypothetical protein